jgi:hypothetical protein
MTGVVLVWLALVLLVVRGAALGSDAAGKVFVVFPPGIARAAAFEAIVAAGGEPLRPALGGWSWIAHADDRGFVGRLRAAGALAAFRGAPAGLALAGCFAWTADGPPHDPFARALEARAAVDR